jgi:hypothetical protein
VLFVGAAVACGQDPTSPEPPEAASAAAAGVGSWTPRAPYPFDVFDAASAAITENATARTTMYVVGGYPRCCGPGLIQDRVRAYDATTDTWTPRAPYPVPIRSTNGAVELDGRIYVSGGFTRRWDAAKQVYRLETVKSLYVYTPSTNTWARKRDMPDATVNGASVAYNGMLYVAAPCYDAGVCPNGPGLVWRYNPATDRWSVVAEGPGDYWNVAAGVINGRLYLVEEFGGAMEIIDLKTGSRISGPTRPYRACSAAAAAWQAKLYLFGLCDDYPTDPEQRDRGLVFDPATNTWSEVVPPPVPAGPNSTLARVFVNARPRLALIGGTKPQNHFHFVP